MLLKMEEYTYLRKKFLENAECHLGSESLGLLKNRFAREVNSARALDSIKNIEDLIVLLEKRGFLRYDRIEPLQEISTNFVHDANINKLLSDYEFWLRGYVWPHKPETNLYKLRNGEYKLQNCHSQLSHLHEPAACVNNGYGGNAHSVILHSPDICYKNGRLMDCKMTVIVDENRLSPCNRQDRVAFNDLSHSMRNSLSVPCDNNSEFNEKNLLNSVESSLVDNNHDAMGTPLLCITQTSELQNIESSTSHDHTSESMSSVNNDNIVQTFFKSPKSALKSLYLIPAIFTIVGFCLVYKIVYFQAVPSAPSQQDPTSSSIEDKKKPGFIHGSGFTTSNPLEFIGNATNRPQYFTEIPVRTTNTALSQEAIKQQAVFIRVSESLGRSWRDVARHLGIRECYIDSIHGNTTLNIKEKAFEALKNFAGDGDPHYWQRDLKRALERARRKDLSELVDELMSRQQ